MYIYIQRGFFIYLPTIKNNPTIKSNESNEWLRSKISLSIWIDSEWKGKIKISDFDVCRPTQRFIDAIATTLYARSKK